MAIVHAQRFQTSAPKPTTNADVRQANEAHARAMPLPRMLDYGMTYADATALHRMADEGIPWIAAAEWLGECNRERANSALSARAQSRAVIAASACYRFAQSAVEGDTPERKRLYRLVIESFATGVGLLPNPPEKLEISTTAGQLAGWLFQPPEGTPAVVVVFGGADGWREAYYALTSDLLAEGLAVCLLDVPGQGESRLFNGAFLNREFGPAMNTVAETLKQQFSRVGLWGNSLGGTLAAFAAATSSNVDAICSNSGSAHPTEIAEKFPRVLDRIAAMAGSGDRTIGAQTLAMLDMTQLLSKLTCPILVLHGAKDALFSLASVQPLYDMAASSDRTMIVWDDGEHCMYSHASERNALVADWFRDRLAT